MAQYMILRESERYVLASGRFLYLFARLEATNMDAAVTSDMCKMLLSNWG